MKLQLFIIFLVICILNGNAYASVKEVTLSGKLLTTAGNSGQSIIISSSGEQFFIEGGTLVGEKIRGVCEYDSICTVTGSIDKNNFIIAVTAVKGTAQNTAFPQAVKEFNNGIYSGAIQVFKTEAKAGNSDALCYLGIMARDGLGVSKDRDKAIKLFKSAIDHGSTEAAVALNNMKNEQQSSIAFNGGEQVAASEAKFSLNNIFESLKKTRWFWIVLIGGAIVLKIMFWYFVITFLWGKLKYLFGRE